MFRLTGTGYGHVFPKLLAESACSLSVTMELLCRSLEVAALRRLGYSGDCLELILDPISEQPQQWPQRPLLAARAAELLREEPLSPVLASTGQFQAMSSSFLPGGYISSSLLDCFHYFDKMESDADPKSVRFFNNHAAHTDSGLMTVVVCTDRPGLEVFDEQLQQWISLEASLQQQLLSDSGDKPWRNYACVFWADSVAYIPRTAGHVDFPKACLHRVQKAGGERYSVVYKQRTSTLKTPPRYQEDYALFDHNRQVVADAAPGVWPAPALDSDVCRLL